MNRRTQSALLALGALLAFVAGVELAVRLVDPNLTLPGREGQFRFDQGHAASRPEHVRDEELGWRLRPDQTSGMRTNARGFRTPRFTDTKPPDRWRIVFLGDSNPLGFGIEDEASPYPVRTQTILERFFADSLPGAPEVLNLAVDGYSSHQVRRLAEALLTRLDPDVVAVQVGFNDYCLASQPDAKRSFARPDLLTVLEHSHAYRWLRRVILSGLPRPALSDPVRRVDVPAYEANVSAIVSVIERAGATPVLLTTPLRPSIPLVMNEERIEDDNGVRYVTQAEWIAERLRRAGLDPPHQLEHPDYVPALERIMAEEPTWAMPPYLIAVAYRKAGRHGDAALLDPVWRARDRERAVFAEYMGALRRVARETGVTLVDLQAALDAYGEERGESGTPDVFLDFVHLDETGHVVVATAVANTLVSLTRASH